MKLIPCLFLAFVVLFFKNTLVAQTAQQEPEDFLPRWKTPYKITPSPNPTQKSWNPAITKRPGHYTIKDWRNLIDSLWGPGISTIEKLQIFDDYWNLVDQTWGGFPNISINWDSLKNVYRPEVAAGVSRGRFYGILSRMSRALNEMHTVIFDIGIDRTQGIDWVGGTEYPNDPSFQYKQGIPIFITPVRFRTNFGAGVTPLSDSTALVYSVIPNHPLNLQPGDIILGYDGIPWKYLISDLYEAELPILGGGLIIGSSPHSAFHIAMLSVGMNWGLFDTIDVFKYSTKETLHFPTSLLKTIVQPYHIATEQLPINGVSFPDLNAKKLVSWGVVEGTTIGYIYVLDWWGRPIGETRILFGQAVRELLNQNISGLILDFRTNYGGWPDYANEGFKQLFNFDPTFYYSQAIRIVGNDHNAFNILPPASAQIFTPGGVIFDRPIAVLVGPNCISSGDYNAFRMRFHPMVRFFGKKTSGAYVAWSNEHEGRWNQDYQYSVYDGSVYSNFNDEGFMIHKSFEVDEEVWLTQSGVAKGEDDVVKRALDWVKALTHAHSAALDRSFYRPGIDSVYLKATLANPLNHTSIISAIVTDSNGSMRDSILLYNDGLHGDGSAGDSVWGCRFLAPTDENMFAVTIRTDDITNGTYRRLPNVRRFTTAGPLRLDSLERRKLTSLYHVKPYIRNSGKNFTVKGAIVNLQSNDPWVKNIGPSSPSLPALPPGVDLPTDGPFSINYDAATFPGYFNFKVDIAINGVIYWADSTKLVLTGVSENKNTLPTAFNLDQNYPNPFNPATVISYQLPVISKVTLKIYDVLGREAATLVNEEQSAGWKEVKWNVGSVSSGIYFYKLTAGNFIDVKKMLVVK